MNKNTIAALALIAIITYGCSKYDDGPGFSLRTKKARLTGEWELDQINGTSVGSIDITWTIERDGEMEACMEYSYYGYSYSDCYDGEWEFEDNGEELEIKMDGGSTETYEINRLSMDELWIERGGTEWEFKKN